jgi:hypothetical protein
LCTSPHLSFVLSKEGYGMSKMYFKMDLG